MLATSLVCKSQPTTAGRPSPKPNGTPLKATLPQAISYLSSM
jgi:hypothetical protein